MLLVLVAAVGAVCWWQWDNIMALKMSYSHSREDISEMMTANNQKVSEAVSQQVEGVTVRDLTADEREAMREGELSREDLLNLLTSGDAGQPEETVPSGSAQQETSGENAAIPADSGTDSNQKKLAEYIAEIYVMKAEYTLWLEDKYEEAIAEYNALEESERTTAAKYSIGMRCMNEALEKEKECDAMMADMEAKISDLLTEMGKDTSLVDDIQAIYEEEKALKKAYYLNLHS